MTTTTVARGTEIIGVKISGSENSKLEMVRRALEANSEIVIIAEEGRQYFPEPSGSWSQTVEIFAAPRCAISSDEGLDQFTRGLIPSIDRSAYDTPPNGRDPYAMLYYDEKLGTVKTTTCKEYEIKDEVLRDLVDRAGASLKNFEEDKEIKRRTWVRVFPNRRSALDYVQDVKDKHGAVSRGWK